MITALSGDVPSTGPTGLAALCFKAEPVAPRDDSEDEGDKAVSSAQVGAVLKKFSSVWLVLVVALRFGIRRTVTRVSSHMRHSHSIQSDL
jgi:hypothetical protein